jgi:DNA-3-methyladenine glycosylase I
MAGQGDGLITGADGRARCWWPGDLPDYTAYHDDEWGRPVAGDARLLEKLCLEGFQAGLSWLTILRKRERFRAVFHGFEPAAVAAMGEADVLRLLQDPGIVRHRGKIEAAIHNAARALEIRAEHGSLAAFLWRFAPPEHERPPRFDRATLAAITRTAASERLAKELLRHGWRFVGPTTCHAFMQATGMVNDHVAGCWCRAEVAAAQAAFMRPA